MAYSRYSKRGTIKNDDLGYRETFFDDRDITQIEQYTNVTTYPWWTP